jgi:signal transduction histidine kinase/DNA-binding response OmpR family regulator
MCCEVSKDLVAMARSNRAISLAIGAAALLLLGLFLAGGLVGNRVLEDGRDQREAVDDSHLVIEALLELRTALFEAVAERNQILIGAPGPHRRDLVEARATIDDQLALLQRLVAENPAQQASATALSGSTTAFSNRLRDTAQPLERGSEAADQLIREAANERQRLLSTTDEMIAEERRLLSWRSAGYGDRLSQVQTIFFTLLGLAMVFAAATLWGIHAYLAGSMQRYAALERTKEQADAANATLEENRGRLQSILDHARDPILLIDDRGAVALANRAAAEQFRQPVPTLIGSAIRELVPAYGVRSGEILGQRADGTTFPAEVSIGSYAEGGRSASVCVLRDVTERRRLDEMKSEFVSTVSHELRTPLTSIRASLGLVVGGVAGDVPEAVKELLEIAHSNSERLVLLVNDILDIEKMESGRLEFRRENTSARRLMTQAVEANRAYGAQFKVTFDIAPGEDALVYADVTRIGQVLANLLSNAAKFSPEGGVVEVALETDAGNAVFSVRDHGRGIPPAFRDRIFQRFAQADSSDVRQKGGTGLGLSISKAIVEHHAGSVGFEDAPGGGTRFFFSLPRLVERLQMPAPVAEHGSRRRALIVEDDADVARLLSMMLEQHGWDSVVANSARRALECLDAGRFDALTLDLMLPDQDGLSLFRQLRQRPDGKLLPIVVISAIADQGKRELNGDAVGVVDWLDKPIDQQRLRDALRQALRGTEGRASILHVEDDHDIVRIVAAVMGDEADVVPARSLAEARARLAGGDRFALVIIDVGLPDGSGLDLIQDLRRLDPPPPVLIFSASDYDSSTARSVAAALVKSRTENRVLHETIRHLIEPVQLIRDPEAAETERGP